MLTSDSTVTSLLISQNFGKLTIFERKMMVTAKFGWKGLNLKNC